jgi:hypothetical protein
MTDKETQPRPEPTEQNPADAEIIERRSLTDAAIVAMPVVVLAQPVVGALAEKYIGQKPKGDPPPQEPKKD